MAIGASEAKAFWTEFLRSLARRGLRGVKLLISDDHKGLKAAATRILGACKDAACTSPGATCWPMPAARAGASSPPSCLRPGGRRRRRPSGVRSPTSSGPRLAVLMDEAEHDVLAYMTFPKEHRQKLHSTNPIERLHA